MLWCVTLAAQGLLARGELRHKLGTSWGIEVCLQFRAFLGRRVAFLDRGGKRVLDQRIRCHLCLLHQLWIWFVSVNWTSLVTQLLLLAYVGHWNHVIVSICRWVRRGKAIDVDWLADGSLDYKVARYGLCLGDGSRCSQKDTRFCAYSTVFLSFHSLDACWLIDLCKTDWAWLGLKWVPTLIDSAAGHGYCVIIWALWDRFVPFQIFSIRVSALLCIFGDHALSIGI